MIIRIFLILSFLVVISCSEQQEKNSYNYTKLLEEAHRIQDSALKDLKVIHELNDSLLDIHFPKL